MYEFEIITQLFPFGISMIFIDDYDVEVYFTDSPGFMSIREFIPGSPTRKFLEANT